MFQSETKSFSYLNQSETEWIDFTWTESCFVLSCFDTFELKWVELMNMMFWFWTKDIFQATAWSWIIHTGAGTWCWIITYFVFVSHAGKVVLGHASECSSRSDTFKRPANDIRWEINAGTAPGEGHEGSGCVTSGLALVQASSGSDRGRGISQCHPPGASHEWHWHGFVVHLCARIVGLIYLFMH